MKKIGPQGARVLAPLLNPQVAWFQNIFTIVLDRDIDIFYGDFWCKTSYDLRYILRYIILDMIQCDTQYYQKTQL